MNYKLKKVYDFIVKYTVNNLYPPSVREIAKGCGYASTSTVTNYLYQLEDMGLLEFPRIGASRCIRLVGYKIVKVE